MILQDLNPPEFQGSGTDICNYVIAVQYPTATVPWEVDIFLGKMSSLRKLTFNRYKPDMSFKYERSLAGNKWTLRMHILDLSLRLESRTVSYFQRPHCSYLYTSAIYVLV